MVIVKRENVVDKQFDAIIVGSGLSGAVIAHELKKQGKHILILERRFHKGGNCYTSNKNPYNIPIQVYGAHIFRTDKKDIWDYVNQFTTMMPFKHKVVVNHNEKLYSFPINLMTLQQVYGRHFTPFSAENMFEDNAIIYDEQNPDVEDNLETHCHRMIGSELYEIFIKGYTEKQWGKSCTELPSSIIKRIPVRFNYNDTYFDSSKVYEGMPIRGYTEIFDNLLKDIPIIYGEDYNSDREFYNSISKMIIYTGPIDELYDVEDLEWRSLEFEHLDYPDNKDVQGVPVMNYTAGDIEYTRIIEHKHFYPYKESNIEGNGSIVTYEYPQDYKPGRDKYYPIPTERNFKIVDELTNRAENDNIILVGRLAEYKYFDMDVAIENALNKLPDILKKLDE